MHEDRTEEGKQGQQATQHPELLGLWQRSPSIKGPNFTELLVCLSSQLPVDYDHVAFTQHLLPNTPHHSSRIAQEKSRISGDGSPRETLVGALSLYLLQLCKKFGIETDTFNPNSGKRGGGGFPASQASSVSVRDLSSQNKAEGLELWLSESACSPRMRT